MLNDLFSIEDEIDVSRFTVKVQEYDVVVELPEDDFNADKTTLFATHLWKGSIILAEEMIQRANLFQNMTVLELGAAAGVPSIIAGKIGASFICSSDYPSNSVLKALKSNLHNNGIQAQVVGHKWGDNVSVLLLELKGRKYDRVIASECLWKHQAHSDLLQTVQNCLIPGGLFILTYSHHINGLEDADNKFFEIAEKIGFKILENKTLFVENQWNDQYIKSLFFVILQYLGD
jgi:nicotinamide N-methyltransferase